MRGLPGKWLPESGAGSEHLEAITQSGTPQCRSNRRCAANCLNQAERTMKIQLDDKRALVTGGNSGIGAAVVEALAEAGAKVAINYVTHPEAAQALVQRIRATGGEALAIEADVANANAVAGMFSQVDEAWGGIDILVNSAGIDGPRALAWEAEVAAWRKVIEVNLLGAYCCAQQALRRMVRQKAGVILSISSVHEVIAWGGYSAYAASKAGLGMMTKTIAQEAAPYGVRVLSLAPGAIQTPINQAVWSDPASLKDLLEKIPLNRMGRPEEIARMVVVLVSDVASYVTGRTVFVDGGMTDYPGFAHGG
jgi:NAD(P)-dependent dehydrogenase (short-subunit alcohol dehydrogenase family)